MHEVPPFSVLFDSSAKGGVVLCTQDDTDRFHLLRGTDGSLDPVDFRLTGRHWFDLVPTDTVCVYAVSARFIAVLRQSRADGWHTRPIRIHGRVIDHHALLIVDGRCGPIDDSKSPRSSRINPSGVEYSVWTGLFFNPATWDGSDVFTPEGLALIFLRDHICRAIHSEELSNVFLRPGATFERLML